MSPPDLPPPLFAGLARRAVRFLLRWFRRAVLVLIALALAAVAWLQFVGVPRPAIDALVRAAARQGVLLEIGSMRLQLDSGLQASNLIWYSARDPLFPMLCAENARLSLSWTSLLTGRLGRQTLDEIELSGCTLRHQSGQGVSHREMRVEGLSTLIRITPDGWEMAAFRAQLLGLDLQVSGRVREEARVSGRKVDFYLVAGAIQLSLEQIEPVYRLLDEVRFTSPPKLILSFDLPAHDPTSTDLRLSLTADAPFQVHSQRFESAALHGRFRQGRLQVDTLRITAPSGEVSLSGVYDTTGNRLTAAARSTLAPDHVLAFCPREFREYMAMLHLSLDGAVGVEAEVSEVPLADVHRRFTARVHFLSARCRDVLARDTRLEVRRDGDRFVFSGIEGRMGEGADAGPFRGAFELDARTHAFRLDFDTRFDPWVILPFIGPEAGAILKGIEFTGPPPHCVGSFEGWRREDGSLGTQLRGTAESGAAIIRGTSFDQARATLDLAATHTHIDGISGLQTGRMIAGSFRIDRRTGMAALDLESTLNPVDIGRIIDPSVERLFASYPVRGASRVEARGEVDIRHLAANRLFGSLEAETMDILGVQAHRVKGLWTLTGDRATFPEVEGEVYGGRVTAMMQIGPLRGADPRSCFVSLNASGVDISRHARSSQEPVQGFLTGRLMLEWSLGDETLKDMAGGGQIELRDATIFKIPLFGGLSRYLSKLISGFGYSSLTRLTATVDIRDRQVRSDDLKIFGNVVSVFMRGNFNFDRDLSFDTQVKLLSEGVISRALQLISWPVTKLLEFRLSGKYDNPDWRPNNLPKELFLQF